MTLHNPMDCSGPGSSVHGISQARILEWVAIRFSRDLPNKRNESASVAWQADSLPLSHQYIYKVKVKVKSLSRVQLFGTPWALAHQAPPSMGFSRQVYWSGLPFPSPGDLPDPGIEPGSPAFQEDALTSEPGPS